jgi:hypothetical protein
MTWVFAALGSDRRGAVNPDANINVVAVYPDGLAVYYGHAVEEDGHTLPRRRLYSRKYGNYGIAQLAAQDYEEAQRNERARRVN